MVSNFFRLTALSIVSLFVAAIPVACTNKGAGFAPGTIDSLYIATQVPASGDIEVDLNKPISITFLSAIDASNLGSVIRVEANGATIPGTWAYDSTTLTATFIPTSSYPDNTTITYTVTTDLRYADGSYVSPATSASFKTLSLADLLGWWRFDGNGTDSSTHGTTLVNSNVTFDSADKVQGSSSAVFNGTSSSFRLGAGNFDLGNQFTVTMWVKVQLQNQILTLISNQAAGVNTNGFKLFINEWMTNNCRILTEAGDGSAGVLLGTAQNFVQAGEWRHLAFTINKSAPAASRALIYFDGVPATQSIINAVGGATQFPNVFETNAATYIGRFPGATALWYLGRMDDYRIYNRVLTAAEIAKIASQR